MRLSPREQESLLVHEAGALAQKRLARGVKLNHPEAVALIASQMQEFVRDGKPVSELMNTGRQLLGLRQVLPGVAEMIPEVQIEATFPDGTKLVTIHQPVARENGDLTLALYGSFLPIPDLAVFDQPHLLQNGAADAPLTVHPGEYFAASHEPIALNTGRATKRLTVTSTCDRPIQIGSHYHFIEANKYLTFDRLASLGMRLNIASGTAVRFSPGETREVNLVSIAGKRVVRGGNGLVNETVEKALKSLPVLKEKIERQSFGNKLQAAAETLSEFQCLMPRLSYIHTYGPTVGDKVRLGDTSLVIEVEKDLISIINGQLKYGDECKFGGGKVLREGMGQAARLTSEETLDTVITNALIVDAVAGIIKADVGIKDGMIVGIGKAGNPDVMDGVTEGMAIGVETEVIAGEGKILTAGGLDAHIHFVCPQLAKEAIASGLTTMFGGGTGPATGTCATTCTPGPNHIKNMIQSTDAFPLNFGFTGKGNTSNADEICREIEEQIEAGAIGLKLHEDWGSTPEAIRTCLRVAEKYDVQVMIHTDTLNESCCVEDTIAAFEGRTIHTYHSEGAGGGHAPDIMKVVGVSNVLPSSTNPTRPFTVNTIDEHLDMLMVCHHLDKNLKEDVAFAESRIRAETIAAEDILHDLGAISMVSSDSQAMGRVGEVITRTWQTADKMKIFRGRLGEETGDNDNLRVKRYIAKYTVNPAVAHGMGHLIGSVEVGKMADLVLWNPAFFGAKPDIIIKGGYIAWAQMGMPNASIPTPEPVKTRKMFGAYGKSVGETSVIFVSQVAGAEIQQKYGINKKAVPVSRCRSVKKEDMILNDFLPDIKIDTESYKVTIKDQGKEKEEHLTCPPAKRLCLAQRYFLF